MAHFRATIQGNRGMASRLGSKWSGLKVSCGGWNEGLKIIARYDTVLMLGRPILPEATDLFDVYWTSGHKGHHESYLGTYIHGTFVERVHP